MCLYQSLTPEIPPESLNRSRRTKYVLGVFSGNFIVNPYKLLWFAGLLSFIVGITTELVWAEGEKNKENTPEQNTVEENVVEEHVPAADVIAAPAKSGTDSFEQYRILIDLIDSVSRNYVHTMTREELIKAAIEGVTSKLDPYSYYIANEEQAELQREVSSCFGGVGMAVDSIDGKTKVIVPLVGMPAYEAGIHCGDEILEIDGISVEEKKIDEVLKLLTGEIGSTVKIKVRRITEKKPIEISITRELIRMETVLGFDRNNDDSWNYWLDEPNGIAYIHITEIRDDTSSEVRRVLTEIQKPRNEQEKSSLKGLILDLRFNPGGDFKVAIELGNMFISDGVIVTAKGKNTVEEVWRATPEVEIPNEIPIVILLNSYSASASEVFSACMQDHHRAIIVGERSYGKGIIQSLMPFEGGTSTLKLTTAGYYSPNGRNIHRHEGDGEADEWGVKPNDEHLVTTSSEEDEQFLADRVRRGTLKTHNDVPTTKNPANYRDMQLEKGLEVLETSLKTGAKASVVLRQRSAPYREEKNVNSGWRSYWRR